MLCTESGLQLACSAQLVGIHATRGTSLSAHTPPPHITLLLAIFLGDIVSFCLGALTRLLTTIPQVLNHNWGGSWHPFVYPALGIFFYSYKYWRKYFSEKIVALDVFRFKLLI